MRMSKYSILIEKLSDETVLLFHSQNNTLLRIKESSYISLVKGVDIDFEEDLEDLKKYGFIVQDSMDEVSVYMDKRNRKSQDFNPSVVKLTILPTMQCNLKCIYCYENNFLSKMSDNVQENLETFVKIILERTRAKKLLVHWFGGEPLLEIDTIINLSKNFIKLCQKLGIKYVASITTNGTLLNKEYCILLSKKCNIKKIQITMDGEISEYIKMKQASEELYENLLRNLPIFMDFFDVIIRFNVCRENFLSVKHLIAFLINEYGISSNLGKNKFNDHKLFFYLMRITAYSSNIFDSITVYTKEEFDEIHKSLAYELFKNYNFLLNSYGYPYSKPLYCNAQARYNFVINYNGDIFRCVHCIKENVSSDYNISKIKNSLFDLSPLVVTSSCLDCSFFPICQGGCNYIRNCTDVDINCESIKRDIVERVRFYFFSHYTNLL